MSKGNAERKKLARIKHQKQKRRAKVNKILFKYRPQHGWKLPQSVEKHKEMIDELLTLNVKYLQVLLEDLQPDGADYYYVGDYRKMIVQAIESHILERTLLK